MTTTAKKSSGAIGGKAVKKAPVRKPAPKKTTTTKPRAAAAAKAPVQEAPQTPGAAANLLAMLVVIALSFWALMMNSIFPNQPAPARPAQPAVHAQPANAPKRVSCEAHNVELMAHGFPPDDCGAAK